MNDHQARFQPKPSWLKVKAPGGVKFNHIRNMVNEKGLSTVCQEARCPNMGECWASGTATFMLMGEICTRACRFCAVKTKAKGQVLDSLEPQKIVDSIATMQLNYVVLTSVDRDDLPDAGAGHFAATVTAIRQQLPDVLIEVLVPDFLHHHQGMETIIKSKPHVIAHNIETVRDLSPKVRDPRCDYDFSLSQLAKIYPAKGDILSKSAIMVGLGETQEQVVASMADLRQANVELLTIGQYLRPTKKHLDVTEFVHPDIFKYYEEIGKEMGFIYVASGPLVRSSYKAGEFFIENVIKKRAQAHQTA